MGQELPWGEPDYRIPRNELRGGDGVGSDRGCGDRASAARDSRGELWDKSYRGVNRIIAFLGMSFGAVMALAVIAVAATVLRPHGIRVESYGTRVTVG